MPVKGTTLTSYRPLMQGVNGMVAASHPSAAMAGLEVLKRGGNAIDAGVAVGLALNVVHVDDCSFLGVAPTVIYLADRNGASRGEGAKLATQGAAVGTAVPDAPEVPRALEMAPNYPNPFNAATIIGFTIPTAKAYERVELAVYDVQGRRIRHLLSRDLPAGNYTVRWDGLLDDGSRAASGLYFSRLRIGSQTATGTMTLVR